MQSQWFHDLLDTINGIAWGPFTIVLLVGTGIFLTIRLRFIQIRRLPHSFAVAAGRYDQPEDTGDVTHFQALCTALSATVGTGNIAGVATAISIGGPGALFWMWVTAAVGMATKYTCCSLALKYRTTNPDGTVSGGPMYYLERGLGQKWLAVLFAIFAAVASFGIGCMVQANSVVDGMKSLLPPALDRHVVADAIPLLGGVAGYKIALGLFMAVMTGVVIIGGIRRIARVASVLVPFMSVFYIGGSLIIIALKAPLVPSVFAQVFQYAFTPVAVGGGFLGMVVMQTIQVGVARGIFSNESGLGSAPIAHAAARARYAVTQGFVAMLEPFTDTLVVCSMTGLVILLSGQWMVTAPNGDLLYGPGGIARPAKHGGALVLAKPSTAQTEPILSDDGQPIPVLTSSTLTIRSFESVLGRVGVWIVAIGLMLFAYSTMISWSYYGDRSVGYLLGYRAVMPYRWIFCVFIFIGSVGGLQTVWTIADILNACMAFPNLIGLLLLSGVVARDTRQYLGLLDSGKLPKRAQTSAAALEGQGSRR